MTEEISRRIGEELGIANLGEILATKISGSDLHSLLLAVMKTRVLNQDPAKLVADSRVGSAAQLDARRLNKIESIALEAVPTFDAVELSPLNPIGSVSTLTGLDLGNVLSTIRAYEVASDPTIGLTLESARRRKKAGNRNTVTRLACIQRVVRFPAPTNPAYSAHFKLFSMITAGKDTGSFSFEIAALKEQLDSYLQFLEKLQEADFEFNNIEVEISDTRLVAILCDHFKIDRDAIKTQVRASDSSSASRLLEKFDELWAKDPIDNDVDLAKYGIPKHLLLQLSMLEENVCKPLRSKHQDVVFKFNLHRLTGLGYYKGPCFHIKMTNHEGLALMLSDGGFVDWTQTILADKKERLLTSAIGIELICRLFQKSSTK